MNILFISKEKNLLVLVKWSYILTLKTKSMIHYINFHTQCQANKIDNIQTFTYVSDFH